jgi:protein transport protein SEC13
VNSIAWAPPELGLHLACASSDGYVSILSHRAQDDGWDVHKGLRCPGGATAVSWAPGSSATPMLATAGCDGNVRLWQGRVVAGGVGGGSSGSSSSSGSGSGSALAWEEVASKVLSFSQDKPPTGSAAEWARDVAWCPAGGAPGAGGAQQQLLAACSDGGRVLLWRSGDAFSAPAQLPPFGHPVWRLSWSPTGRLLAVTCGDNSVTLWKEDMAGTWMSVCNAPVNVEVQ